jgi:nucleotide-binding universal stress UspA family protein
MSATIATILVPLDVGEPCEAIAGWAIEWARMKRSRLVLLHVLPQVNAYATPVFVDQRTYDDYYARAREGATGRMERIAATAFAAGVEATVSVRVGFAAEEILAAAREEGADLIILGTHGRRGLAHLVLGSTAEKVVRLAHCSVFVVKEPHPVGQEGQAESQSAGTA